VHRFVNGDEDVRRRKLEVILQLGIDKEGLSFLGRCLLWWLSLLLRATLRRRVRVPQPASSNDRTSVPALNLSECGDTFHFGGSLQTNHKLPMNYVASTVHMESRRNNNLVTRMLLSYIEFGGLSRNVSDFTFILAGEEEDELPERALCTSRTVRSNMNTLPLSCMSLYDDTCNLELKVVEPPKRADRGIGSLFVKIFVSDPVVAATSSIVRSVQGIRNGPTHFNPTSPAHALLHASLKSNRTKGKAIVDVAATDPFQQAVNELVRILEDITVPVRFHHVHEVGNYEKVNNGTATALVAGSLASGVSLAQPQKGDLAQISILRTVSRDDIQRYFIASNCSLKTASVRLVDSAVWRGLTFPIDTRTCRVELQSGQFFQQGEDLDGNPVFYFRNTCLGPWRKDDDAVVAAVLHRLEASLTELSKENPDVQCTLIVIMGRPYRRKNKMKKKTEVPERSKTEKEKEKDDQTEQATVASTAVFTQQEEGDDESDDEDATLNEQNDDFDEAVKAAQTNNPRIYRDELWNTHTSKLFITRIVDILLTHYPERLNKALVVVGHGNKKYVRSAVGGVISIAGLIRPSRTRDKIRFLTRYRDLQTYVDRSQLVTLVGGTQVEDAKHYECS
jgi:hypothetical protein